VNIAISHSKLGAKQLAALNDCAPTLRRLPHGWRKAPAGSTSPYHPAFLIRDLIEGGFLEMGGSGWGQLTPAGRRVLGGAQ
jgi:hypothetical protein